MLDCRKINVAVVLTRGVYFTSCADQRGLLVRA